MKLEERIKNIKALLDIFPLATDEGKIVQEDVGLFFANLFNNDERFIHTPYDRVYPIFELSSVYRNKDNKTFSSTIEVSYEYYYDKARGYHIANCIFNDPDLDDTWAYADVKRDTMIQYSEIPDNIWQIIQNTLYERVSDNISKKLNSAKEAVTYWENVENKFKNNLSLTKEDV